MVLFKLIWAISARTKVGKQFGKERLQIVFERIIIGLKRRLRLHFLNGWPLHQFYLMLS